MPLTRRGFLAGSLAALAARGLGEASSAPAAPVAPRSFVSRPDLRPPVVAVNTSSSTVAPGLVFIAPFRIGGTAGPGYGALIVDGHGEPVWFRPEQTVTAMNFRVQHYRGQPVLTWYEGDVLGGYGGDFVIADSSYRVLHTVKAANGQHGDLHEFLITSRNTALITIYANVAADLTSVGGTASGQLTEGVIQEIDIETGKVLFEWHSTTQIPLSESLFPGLRNDVADYFHLNSVGVDIDGDLLVSARHTSTVYKLDRDSGRIIWRLGGSRSDFTIVPGAEFYTYADKYEDGTAQLLAPAPITDEQRATVRSLAVRAFEACRCEAMARVDFFLEEQRPDGGPGRGFLLNELNTIPGFTPISMYPRLWDISGVPYPKLLDRLIELALDRHARRARRAGTQR